jgi:hypothetical protein
MTQQQQQLLVVGMVEATPQGMMQRQQQGGSIVNLGGMAWLHQGATHQQQGAGVIQPRVHTPCGSRHQGMPALVAATSRLQLLASHMPRTYSSQAWGCLQHLLQVPLGPFHSTTTTSLHTSSSSMRQGSSRRSKSLNGSALKWPSGWLLAAAAAGQLLLPAAAQVAQMVAKSYNVGMQQVAVGQQVVPPRVPGAPAGAA